MKIVYTYGVFDILHPGHISLLERAKALGDYLIVGIVCDEAVRERKGKGRPIQNQYDRARIVGALKCVDEVVIQGMFNPCGVLFAKHFLGQTVSILCKGDDWKYIPGKDAIEMLGGKLVKLPYSKEWSTSKIIKDVRSKSVFIIRDKR